MKKIFLMLLLQLFLVSFLMSQNPRNVLIYNLTSTDCGPCSCMDSILGRIAQPLFPRTVVVALHGIGSKFGVYHGSDIYNSFNAKYDPSGFMDGLGYDISYENIKDSLAKRYLRSPEAPVKIQIVSKTWNASTRTVDFTVNFTNLGSEMSGLYKVNVFVTENNIKWTHRIMDGCATPDDPSGLPLRNNYINMWVTRDVVFSVAGDSLTGPSWPGQQVLTKTCSFHVDTAWIAENCNFVVMAYLNADSIYKAHVQQVVLQSVTHSLGIAETTPARDGILNVFPNPSQGQSNIHISLSTEGSCRLSIFDINGREVENLLDGRMKPGLYNVEINTREYLPGTYIAILTSSSGKTQARFVVK